MSVNADSMMWGAKFLKAMPKGLPEPEVEFDPDGETVVEWWSLGHGTFSISFSASGVMQYAGLFGVVDHPHGNVKFDGKTIPAEILDYIRRAGTDV